MKHHDDRPAKGSEALVVANVAADEVPGATPGVCAVCGGPAPLCGGVERCTGGPRSALELRWLTAIRAVYAGLVLTRTLAALWGGALLRFAHQLAAGALASGSPSPSIADLASEHANPGCAAPGHILASLTLAYLEHGDLDRLSDLSRLLRDADAPWLVELGIVGLRAAVATPLDRERYALVAVLCDDCASNEGVAGSALALERLYEPVANYDAAIRCPCCGSLPAHPLPGVTLEEPHPVGRCVPSAGSAPRVCRIHDGDTLDEEGLCVEGRKTFDRAVLEVAKMGRASTPFERDLVESLLRARRRAFNARIDDAAIARGVVNSAALRPFFAALAATDPEAARDLAQIAGAPIDTTTADPGVLAALTAGGGIAGMIANGRAALANLRDSLSGTPRVLASPRRPPKHRRHKGSRR